MELFVKRHWFKLLVGLLALVVIGAVVYSQIVRTAALPVQGKAANFEFTNLDGQKVTMQGMNGKVRLVYFFWSSCPDVCLPTTHMISKVQEGLKKEGIFDKTKLISITFDPARDTTEQLKEVASRNGADLSGWYFLRGDEQYAKKIANKYGVAVAKDKDNMFIHTNRIVLVDKDGNVRKGYNGTDLNLKTDEIVQDMKGLVEK